MLWAILQIGGGRSGMKERHFVWVDMEVGWHRNEHLNRKGLFMS